MRAVTWHGKHDVRVDTVPDPKIVNPHDIVIKTTATAICGSDLHLYDGMIPSMVSGDILGHEFMGEVVEVGPEVHNLKGRRPGGEPLHHRLRPVRPLPRPVLERVRELQPVGQRRRSWRRCTATPAPACSAIRT